MKHRLIVALFLMCSMVCFADDATVESSVLTFRATVLDSRTPYSGRVIPVHFDPMFLLLVKIESSDSQLSEFQAGKMVKFAIHSPSQLFGLDDPQGKTFTFSLVREAEGKKERFRFLTVVTKQPNQALEHNAYVRHAACGARVAPDTGVAHLY